MNRHLSHILPFLLFMVSACTKTIEIDLPQHDSKTVVNCFFQVDSLFSLEVGKSFSIFDKRPSPIKSAKVELFTEGQSIDTFYYDGERYRSHIYPEVNKNYHIEVTTTEGELASADSYIPNTPILEFISLEDSVYTDEEGLFIAQLKVIISDTSYADNFYELKLLGKSVNFQNDSILLEAYYDLINDQVFKEEELLAYYPESLVFSNALFKGEDYAMTVNFRWGSSHDTYDGLIIILRAVTKEYYEYKKSLTLHIERQSGDIWDGVGAPIEMVSNIDNGYGIFAGYSELIQIVNK